MKILKIFTHEHDTRRRVLIYEREDGFFSFVYENKHVHIDEEFDVPGGIYETADSAEHTVRSSVPWLSSGNEE